LPSSSNTSKTKNESKKAPTFVCEIPLRISPTVGRTLDRRMESARQVYNACLDEAFKRQRLLVENRRYQAARRMKPGEAWTVAFSESRKKVGFTDYAIQHHAVEIRNAVFQGQLDVHVVQKLGTRAYEAVNRWILNQGGRPRFKGFAQLDTVEGKSNDAGIRWREDHVEWRGLALPARIDPRDEVVAYGLAHRVKYVRLVRRRVHGESRFWAQLVLEGIPYRKIDPKTGSFKHPWQQGEVGIDLGPQTVGVVSAGKAFLRTLCEEVVGHHRVIRRIQRHLDRQRRANNPENYQLDGRVKPGPKRWKKSSRMKRAEARLADLSRREKGHRKTLHGRLANEILAMGTVIRLEKIPYRAFQRAYGRSVSIRAPGAYVEILRRKAESAGGQVIEFPTRTTKLSQTCQCGMVRKKPLSQRVHSCECGIEMQRDLYSAFLAWCVNDDGMLHADRARERWSGVEPLLRAAWSQATEPASGRLRPSSFGASPRSQSGSPAEGGQPRLRLGML